MMQVSRPELHAYGLRAFLDVGRASMGDQAVDEILHRYGVTQETVQDPEGWVSLEFIEALIGDLVTRSGDPELVDRAARASISQKYLGPIYTFVRAFGSVGSTYDQIAKSTPRFNKTGTYRIQHLGPGSVRLDFSPTPGIEPERTLFMCRNRRVQLATMPTIFDLAPAQVEEPKCMLRGDECCSYVLHWTVPTTRWRSQVLALVGIAGGFAAASAADLPTTLVAGAAALLGLGGWLAGRNVELRQDLGDRVKDLGDHQEALARSMRTTEERFAELLDAKAEVEKKVDERTLELKEASTKLSETLEEVRAVDRAKTDFFNNVSHELRSPLTMIVAPLEDLAEGRVPPGGTQGALEAMRRNARRLLQLINQLLDLAKVDAGEVRVAPVPTDVAALLRGVLAGFESAAGRKGVKLELSCPPSTQSLAVDVSWIESAITNLVANALRVTEQGGVRVSVEDRGSDVVISVADDGPGIASEDQAKIFERFAQGDIGKRVVGGTGIGLSLVREAARLHQGSVAVSSEVGKGATFVLTLPRRAIAHSAPPRALAAGSAAGEGAALMAELDAAATNTDRDGPSTDAPMVVIVEDNVELRRFMADVLAARFRVKSATDGVEALKLVHLYRPEVVVSDVAMPRMNGYELCRALRADEQTRSIPVLLVTARTEVASVLEGFDAGASDYVLKPFHGRELLARVDVHVRLRRMLHQLALRERHAMLGVMAASVAHQVRNPLTALVGGLPAMRGRVKERVDERTLELIDVMIDCAARIERMTSDLMNLSRVDREIESAYKPSDGLRSAIRLARARADATGLQFEEQIEDAPLMSGRPGDMNHVFLNLIDNAIRAAGQGGTVRVEEGVAAGSHYVVRIGDSGPGIDPANVPHIFEPFFTTRAAGEGTGLGLGVALQVVTACGGGIDVERSELGGALFVVRVPIRPATPRSTERAATA